LKYKFYIKLAFLTDSLVNDLSYRVLNDRNFSYIHNNLLHRVVVELVCAVIICPFIHIPTFTETTRNAVINRCHYRRAGGAGGECEGGCVKHKDLTPVYKPN